MRTIAPVVYRAPGVPLVGGSVYVDDNGPNGGIRGTTNTDGYTLDARTALAPIVNDGLPYFIQVQAPGFLPYALGFNGKGSSLVPNVMLPDTGNYDLIIGPAGHPLGDHQLQCPALAPAAPVAVATAPIRSYSFFDFYHQHLDGTLRDTVIQQVKDLGFNVVRVFMNWGNIGFDPGTYGERFFTEIPVAWRRLASFGLSGEMVLIAPKPYAASLGTLAQQLAFVDRCRIARAGVTNGIEELVNEGWLVGFPYASFAPPTDWKASSGAPIDWDNRNTHLWELVTYHGERTGHHIINDMVPTEATEQTGKRCWNDEPAKGIDYGYDPVIANRMGRAGRVFGDATFHSAWGEGQNCQLLTGAVRDCATAFFEGLAT